MYIKKYIGNKSFYKMVLLIAIPIMIQNGITNFVGMLDNIMVGQVGTEQMSGVAIANQLIFVFNMCIFGGVSGAGIFAAQFYGNKNHKGVRETFRFKLLICAALCVAAFIIFGFFGEQLVSMFLHKSSAGDLALTLMYSKKYLRIMLIQLIPFAIMEAYASTLRECSETVLPMKAGIAAVFINLVLNYVLIFGNFGVPKLGVEGAAIATVIARFAECMIVVIWTHRHKEKNIFICGVYKSLRIPKKLTLMIIKKGLPLMLNEALWSGGMTTLTQCYSLRGLSAVAGMNISITLFNVLSITYVALGSSIAIIVGNLLGAGKMKEAKDTSGKLIAFSVTSCFAVGIIMALISPYFPMIYNTTKEVRDLAKDFILISAIFMPVNAFIHASYFTIRSGGKTLITFLFDSAFMWTVSIPIAYCLSRFTGLNIVSLYAVICSVDIIKCIIGYILVKKGSWMQNIIE